MLQKITDLWPQLFGENKVEDTESDEEQEDAEQEQEDEDIPVEETYKNLKWSRVIALQDYDDNMLSSYNMKTDIMDALQQMKDIDVNSLP